MTQEERIAILETNYIHMASKIDVMSDKVDDMHETLTQAKGAKWMLLAMAAIGGFASSQIGAITGLFGK